jgi:hypothetical protein
MINMYKWINWCSKLQREREREQEQEKKGKILW